MQLEIGTLVMWNNPLHKEHKCCGIIISTTIEPKEIKYNSNFSFCVEWFDGPGGTFGSSMIRNNKIKIINF